MAKKVFTNESLATFVDEIKSYTNETIEDAVSSKAESSHNHDDSYDSIGSADAALALAKEYTNERTSGIASSSVVDDKISTHNTSSSAHDDIRGLISDIGGDLSSHTSNKTNPHGVTLSQLGVTATSTELNYVDGVTSSIQSQLDSKADENHGHAISDITNLQSTLDNKAASSHGTHVSYSSTAPVMDGSASVGSASTVARSDHKHPTDTSRAAATDLTSHTSNKSNPHSVTKSQVGLGNVDNTADADKNVKSAIEDADGQVISETYIKNLSVSGKTITYTRGNDTTGTITTQDTTYTSLKNPYSLTIQGNGTTLANGTYDGSSAQTVNITPDNIGAAKSSHTHSAYAASSHSHDDKYYTESEIDAKFDAIIGEGASETLDTIGEISAAITSNQSMLSTLNSAIGNKANASDLSSHTGNTTVHITSTERTNWNAAKTHADSAHAPSNAEVNQNAFSNIAVGSTTIAADSKTDTLTLVGSNVTLTPDATNDKVTIGITKSNVTTALGYTPPTTDTTYGVATSSALGLVKSGTDITVDSSGNVSVNNNSHTHTVSNISDLTATAAELNIMDGVTATTAEINCLKGVTSAIQSQLDSKSASDHTHKYAGSSSAGGAATSAAKLNTDAGSATQPVYFENGVPKATTYTLGKSVPSNAVFTDTDTHYTSKNVVGSSTATSNTTSKLTNGNVYLNSVENGAVTSTHKISGSGATTVTTDTSGNIVISSTDNNTTYSDATQSAAGLMSADDKKKLDGIATGANNYTYTLPTASSSTLGGVKIGSNISISSGTISVPTASGTAAGVTIVYPAASCTTFSSDSGTVTPLAVQKGAKMFAITRPSSSTNKAITRYSNTTGDVQDSKIIIEDVTNSKDSSKKAQVIAIPAEGGKKMVYGYCTDQVDGTSFIGGVFDASATSYPYSSGLAIGGTSGNLLWKGKRVLDNDDLTTLNNAINSKGTSNLTIGTTSTTAAAGNHTHSGYAAASHTSDTTAHITAAERTAWNAKGTSNLTIGTTSTTAAAGNHTHKYAGASSAGGSATSAVKLDTATAGSSTQPVYFTGGKPSACTYTLGKSVPSDAKFTDTTYSAATTSAAGLMSANDKKNLNSLVSPTVYTDKITVNSSYFEIVTSQLVDMGNGMIYGRVMGKLLADRSAVQIGYVNADFAPTNSVPANICVGKSDTTYNATDCKVNGTGSEERARQIYARFATTVPTGTYLYVNFMYYKD